MSGFVSEEGSSLFLSEEEFPHVARAEFAKTHGHVAASDEEAMQWYAQAQADHSAEVLGVVREVWRQVEELQEKEGASREEAHISLATGVSVAKIRKLGGVGKGRGR